VVEPIAIILAIIVLVLLITLWQTKTKVTKKLDVSALDLLHELTTRGSAIVRLEVIDQGQLFLRSPRE